MNYPITIVTYRDIGADRYKIENLEKTLILFELGTLYNITPRIIIIVFILLYFGQKDIIDIFHNWQW